MIKPLSSACNQPSVANISPRAAGVAMLFAFALFPFSVSADSLWKDDVARPLVADKRAVAVGDILTIAVQESTTTAKDNNTKTSKQSGVDASISSFLYPQSANTGWLTKGGKLPAMKFDAKSDFNGGGAINNSEKIVARIAVRVVDVLPNRNLIIEGSRETAFSGEQQTAILRGTVRPEDIAGNNTVFSYNIADATIKFVSKGTISDNQRKGWFTKIWDKVSPF
ncbi:MAG TPA: flagellar basal body L-ring protein FlgH [Candidatus Acidoferrum sp.]|nr:flagellar basal body L-ring protein FlgH [Candidatus Acidoferrum sp.]